MNETFANTFKNAQTASTAITAVRGRKFIVGSLSEDGRFSISATPVTHDSAQSAKAECARLAKQNPGTAYVAMQFVCGALVPKMVGVAEF